MDVYLVGGAVRDRLLGRPVSERDWVVVGATVEQLREQGFTQVGRDFPVFLHPQTHEEYALARTERKSAPGHRGFVVHAGPEVTLEDDLLRRDLTINAIAEAPDGSLIDPFAGQKDLERRVLRHVSEAFSEDPLRVFRVARFAALLPGFEVAEETVTLMRRMATAGQLRELSAERVAQEFHKVLARRGDVQRFLSVLAEVDALVDWFGEWRGKTAPELSEQLEEAGQRYAALARALDAPAIAALGTRLKWNQKDQQLALDYRRWYSLLMVWSRTPTRAVEPLIADLHAFSARSRLPALEPLLRHQHGVDVSPLLRALEQSRSQVTASVLLAEGMAPGPALGEALFTRRLGAFTELRPPLNADG